MQKLFVEAFFSKEKISHYVKYAVLPGVMFYAVALWILHVAGYSATQILRDTAQQTGKSSLLGFLSNVGIWWWVSAAAVSFFGVILHGKTLKNKHNLMLFLLGFFSLMLAIDDFYLIHDLYIDQNICYAFYAIYALTLLAYFFKEIIQHDGLFFLIAGVLLACSILCDLLQESLPFSYNHVQIVEEGFKFMGGITWLYFCGCAALAKTKF